MTISAPANSVEAVAVRCTEEALVVDLSDGRTISVPLQWFPRLLHGRPDERAKFEVSHAGIHWPDLNEDIAVDALLRGEHSDESPKSIQRWLDYRARGLKEPIPAASLPSDIEAELRRMGIETK